MTDSSYNSSASDQEEAELLQKIETAVTQDHELQDLGFYMRQKTLLYRIGLLLCLVVFIASSLLFIPRIRDNLGILELTDILQQFILPGYLILFFVSYQAIIAWLNVRRQYYRLYRTRDRLLEAIHEAKRVIDGRHKQQREY